MLVENMVWATALMALVLFIRAPFSALFGAGPAYALWLLPPLRLLMPPLPDTEIPNLLPPVGLIVEADAGAGGSAASASGWLPWLLAAWAVGTLAFLAWQFLAYRAFLTRLSLTARSLGAHDGLPLVESAAVEGPLALGLLDRRIVVPADFECRYSPAERRLALDHEAIHHRRGDIWWNLAALLVLALNWFNPVAWLAFRAFREDQELACDAAVAGRADAKDRHDYARALVKSASRPGLVAVCPLNRTDQLKRRLRMMSTHKSSKTRLFGGAAAVLTLAAASLMLGSAGVAHPHPEGEEQRREHRVIIMEKHGDGDHAAHGEGAVRQFTLRRGENGEIVLPEGCSEGEPLANVDETDGNERTRVLLCGRGDGAPADRVERLQRVRDRLAQNEELSAEQRQRVTAALDREIARLRGR